MADVIKFFFKCLHTGPLNLDIKYKMVDTFLGTVKEKDLGVTIRKYSFSQRTINEWNKLSTDCVTASSVNMFKNKISQEGGLKID